MRFRKRRNTMPVSRQKKGTPSIPDPSTAEQASPLAPFCKDQLEMSKPMNQREETIDQHGPELWVTPKATTQQKEKQQQDTARPTPGPAAPTTHRLWWSDSTLSP